MQLTDRWSLLMRDRNKQIKKKRRIRQIKARLTLLLILVLLILVLLGVVVWKGMVKKSRSDGKKQTTSTSELSISTGMLIQTVTRRRRQKLQRNVWPV